MRSEEPSFQSARGPSHLRRSPRRRTRLVGFPSALGRLSKAAVKRGLAATFERPIPGRLLQDASLAGFVPDSIWRRIPARGDFEVRMAGETFLYHGLANDPLDPRLRWGGGTGWEAETLPTFVSVARDARRFVDVGANTGVYTLLACAANPIIEVLSLEPVPHVFARLRHNVSLNEWSDRCELLPVAATDTCGRFELVVPSGPSPRTAHLASSSHRSGRSGTSLCVDGLTLDELLATRSVDLIKIDVEGSEGQVLRGMTRVLQRDHPTLVLEVLPEGDTEEINALLRTAGYRFFHLSASGAIEQPTLAADPSRRNRNWLCAGRPGVVGSIRRTSG